MMTQDTERVIESNAVDIQEEHVEAMQQLRQAVDEIAKNHAEHETGELNRAMDRAFDRYDKVIDRLFELLYRLEQSDQDRNDKVGDEE